MSRNYKFKNKVGAYFVSFATVYWIDVFTRQPYLGILEESLNFCRKEKGMEVFAYCFMPSHVHLIFRSADDNPSGVLRDFKKHTSKKVLKAIEENPQESRRECLPAGQAGLLWMFERAGQKKGNILKYPPKHRGWQHQNKPIELWSTAVIKQKLDYIHNNPVEAGFVTEPTQWKYSSARNFAEDHTFLGIDDIGFLG